MLYVDVDDTIPTAPIRSNLPNPNPRVTECRHWAPEGCNMGWRNGCKKLHGTFILNGNSLCFFLWVTGKSRKNILKKNVFSLKAFCKRLVFFLKHSLREKNCESVNPSTLEPGVEVCLSFKVVSQKIVVRSTGQPRLNLAWWRFFGRNRQFCWWSSLKLAGVYQSGVT